MLSLLKIYARWRFARNHLSGNPDGSWVVRAWAGLIAAVVIGLVPVVNAASPEAGRAQFTRDFVPLFKEYCFDCHNDKKSKGDINLQQRTQSLAFADDFKTWELVAEMLEDGEMPPEDEPQPDENQRRQLVSAIRAELDRSVLQRSGDPGRIVLRRLTSAEYAYTIQDLTGLDLDLANTLVGDAVGGEGFSNVGDVQFVQDSTIEQYLRAAKKVASHAVIGAGPLRFYSDPGMTGQELSAIHRIQAIYQEHGFSTGAGEGAEAFGLERYPKAFFASWRYQHRAALGLPDLTLEELSEDEGIEVGFLEHIWITLNEESPTFPSSEIASRWKALPEPEADGAIREESLRADCSGLYDLLRSWQTTLAANSVDDEESPTLTEDNFRPTLEHSFRVRVNRPRGATHAAVELSVNATSGAEARPAVLWKNPGVMFRIQGETNRAVSPLMELIDKDDDDAPDFGRGISGDIIEPGDFVTLGNRTMTVRFRVPEEAARVTLFVDVELDVERGDDCIVRCVISDGRVEGETIASTGASSALLANPKGAEIESWKQGVALFARNLPQVSHRKPAPSDRDPIPAPFDSTYNKPERNDFHYIIKYHRDDRFLSKFMLDDAAREELDAAWIDLLTSFDYYETFFRFVDKKFELNLGDLTIANLEQERIDDLPEEPRVFVQDLHDRFNASRERLQSAESGHLDDAMRFAELAWRRPLSDLEKSRLRGFYSSVRMDSELGHVDSVRSLLARILVAPAFLYRIESPAEGDGVVPLSDWELASRLSYFLWSSQPDKMLLQAAAEGRLTDPRELAAQARRMLRDPKARRLATEFFGQWFGFYRFDQYQGVDTGRFTEFTDELKSAMYDEAISLFDHMIREDRSIQDILFADHTFLNHPLARHYGIDLSSVPEDELTKVVGVRAHGRGGLLQLGAVLTVTSAPLRTSPVKRGDWILRRVIGAPVPAPPADAGSIPADDVLADGLTVRERLEVHRRDPSCANCHSRIDPLGFALEHFDSIGRWRDTYRDGQTIETTGIMNDGTEISELEGLLHYLQRNEALFARNLSAKLLGYALGRTELVSDRPLLEQMAAGVKSDDRFSNLILQIVTSRQFRNQRGRDSDSQMTLNESPLRASNREL